MKRKSKRRILIIFILIILLLLNIKNIVRMSYPDTYKDTVLQYSEQYNIDPNLAFAVIKAESNFNKTATSSQDAKGLMQITPSTGKWIAEKMGVKNFDIEELYNPETNIKMGIWYLNDLMTEFDGNIDLVLAAYNGGRGNVNKWLEDQNYSKNGVDLHNIPFKETDQYVKRVKVNLEIYKKLYDFYNN